jgi:hypothetical protein
MTRLVHLRTLGWGLVTLAVGGIAAGHDQSPPSPQYSDVFLAGKGGYQALVWLTEGKDR